MKKGPAGAKGMERAPALCGPGVSDRPARRTGRIPDRQNLAEIVPPKVRGSLKAPVTALDAWV
jgi:hypothetical protein